MKPAFTEAEVRSICELWNIQPHGVHELDSYEDQTFRIEAGAKYVLKIANKAANQSSLEMQNEIMLHCHAERFLFVPGVLLSSNGKHIEMYQGHCVRMLDYLEGAPMGQSERSFAELFELGRLVGSFTRTMSSFSHPNASYDFKWDMCNILAVRELVPLFPSEQRRALVLRFLAQLERHQTQLDSMRRSVIHGDLNEFNVIMRGSHVSALIDFGDAHYSRTVHEIAIAMGYAMLAKDDPLTAACSVLAGYHREFPLLQDEIDVLYSLATARLCMSVCHSTAAQAHDPNNAYIVVSQAPSWRALEHLDANIHPNLAIYRMRHACGLIASPQRVLLDSLIEQRGNNWADFASPIDVDLHHRANYCVFDFTQGGDVSELDLSDVRIVSQAIEQAMRKCNVPVGIGRYNERRTIYREDSYRTGIDGKSEARTVHLGIDLFAPAGTPVRAVLNGIVHSVQNNTANLDYGPCVILEHCVDVSAKQLRFYTLYGHLDESALQLRVGQSVQRGEQIARFGDFPLNGNWPPHVHFQITLDMLGKFGDFPGVACASESAVWLSLCPNVEKALGVQCEAHWSLRHTRSVLELLRFRSLHLSNALSTSFRRPLKIVRGELQYLFDDTGRRYLDAYNNVSHVGHCAPAVVAAAQRQMAQLCTNTRYLSDQLADYVGAVLSTLPPSFEVVFVVNSGSEANDLALRLARAHTRAHDVVVLDHAYHGHTEATIECSPYKFNRRGGSGKPAHTHVVDAPDGYRGKHRYAPDYGVRYAV
jgi:Ser/Thr protein kinase RdoA (MazF antagonist)